VIRGSVTLREVIPDKLWIGNAADARNVTDVLGLGIAAIVDLAIEEQPIQFPRDVVYCRFPLIDGAGNHPAILRAAIEMTANFIASETPMLVACGAGVSRSPAIVAAATAKTERITLADALGKVAAGEPHDVSPGLLEEVSKVLTQMDSITDDAD
jgi:protein-tyrosine phosphatase